MRFVRGHDGRLVHMLYRAALNDRPVMIYDTVYRPDTYAAKVGPVFAGYFHQLVTEARGR